MLSRLILILAMTFVTGIAEDEGRKDLARMQGDWAAAQMVRDGNPIPDEECQALFRTVKDNGYTVFRFERPVGKGTIKVDATTTPRSIEASPAGVPAGTPPMLGIYSWEGERLRICFAGPGKDRPKDFECKPGSGHTLTVWEREKGK